MAVSRGRPHPLVLLPLCFLLHFYGDFGSSFGLPNQESLQAVRERTGQSLRLKARGTYPFTLTKAERHLLSEISRAGKARNWLEVRSAFDAYEGSAAPVFSAAMHAAFKCRMYEEGAEVYDKARRSCTYVHQPVFVAAIKLFGKLGKQALVQKTWEEALEANGLSEVLASARISAAANAGEVEVAASVLDQMKDEGVQIGVGHLSSAIRACWGFGKGQHRAAKYFFELCPELNVKPNLVTFTSLIGAYKTAPLEDIIAAQHDMKKRQILPDSAFAETFLVSVLQGSKQVSWRDPDTTASSLQNTPLVRLKAAKVALADFERAGVRLTSLCINVKEALILLKVTIGVFWYFSYCRRFLDFSTLSCVTKGASESYELILVEIKCTTPEWGGP